jgi:DNA-binding transcriptional regulator YiaG
MNIEMLKRKFQLELSRFMKSNGLNSMSTAWLLDCHRKTVENWESGRTLPSRNNALMLAYFAENVRTVLNLLAGVDAAAVRFAEHRSQGGKKAA